MTLNTFETVGGLLLIVALVGAICATLRRMRREIRRDMQQIIWPVAAYLACLMTQMRYDRPHIFEHSAPVYHRDAMLPTYRAASMQA